MFEPAERGEKKLRVGACGAPDQSQWTGRALLGLGPEDPATTLLCVASNTVSLQSAFPSLVQKLSSQRRRVIERRSHCADHPSTDAPPKDAPVLVITASRTM